MSSSKSAFSNSTIRRSVAVLAFGVAALGASSAFAQDGTATATATAAPMAPATGGISGAAGTDHAKVVNHLGFTYLGISGVPLAKAAGGSETLSAPVIGVRYWLNEGMAIDAGIGLAYASGSSEGKTGGVTVTKDDPSKLGAIVHVGVPIVLGTPGKHYTFTLVPEANVGFASSTVKDQPAPGATAAPDIELSGFLLNAGARLGAEVQFGFIGIPELALQGSVGLGFNYTSVKGKQGPNEASASSLGFGTGLQNNPWGIFTNSVAAIYYF